MDFDKHLRRVAEMDVRKCFSCEGTTRIVSVSQVVYVKGSKLKTGRRVIICENCLVKAVLGKPTDITRAKVSTLMLESVSAVYKTIRGVE